MEQRYKAVMEVLEARIPVTEVAERYGVSRQSVHNWIVRYRMDGIGALIDRTHKPKGHPDQIDAVLEAAICELRRQHPRYGPRTLVYWLAKKGISPVPSRSTVYRVLVRNNLITPIARKRRRDSFVRWEREVSMELWQHDIISGVFLADGTECKVVTGIDDHSRFCVLAKVVRRATARQVCLAFAQALSTYGIPDEVLSDNGVQFTGRLIRPQHRSEVLFERICRENEIVQRFTKVATPTTTGKIERLHLTMRRELLDEHGPFADIADAQAGFDTWRADYNEVRPHQSRDMATPASLFVPRLDRSPNWCSLPSSRSWPARVAGSSKHQKSPSTSPTIRSAHPRTSVPSSSPASCRRAATSRSQNSRSGSGPRRPGAWSPSGPTPSACMSRSRASTSRRSPHA